jgi:hypothetical protein
MRNQQLKEILKNVKNERRGGNPRESWVRQSRDILLMQVRNTVVADAKPVLRDQVRHLFDIFVPVEGMLMTARAVGVFMLVIGSVLGGGLVSAQVYREAVPGSLSYGMKVAIERAQVALAPNDEYRTRLHAEFADRRMDEVAQLAEGASVRQARVPETLAAFRGEIAALAAGLESLRTSDQAHVVETAKLLERKMAVYQNQLRKASALMPASLLPSVAATRDSLDGVTIKAMAVIVEHHLAGDIEAPAAVVISKFEDRIKAAETKIDAAPAAPKSTEAKAAIAAAKELIKEEDYQAALLKITEVVELTKESADEPAPVEAAPADGEGVTPAGPAPAAEGAAGSDNVTTEGSAASEVK